MSNLSGVDIGRYHIVEQLGQGGMATVYKAFDTRLERYVAIKFIRRSAISEEQIGNLLIRFEREAKALAKFSHANIVKVYDYGEYDGAPYLVMEFVEGGTLKDKVGRILPETEATKLLIPIAYALDYAHRRGIIHRDIKPANILINSDEDQPMLSDFGIAKVLEDESTGLTGTGVGIGTPEYMSPEQGAGQIVDNRVDIYSLGIIYYELTTGKKPFTADTPLAIVLKHISEPLPRPRDINPGISQETEALLFKALAKKPEDRFEDMKAFAKALESIASRIPIEDTVIDIKDRTMTMSSETREKEEIKSQKIKPVLPSSPSSEPSSIEKSPGKIQSETIKPAQKTTIKMSIKWNSILIIAVLLGLVLLCVGVFGILLPYRSSQMSAASGSAYFVSSRDGKMDIYRQQFGGLPQRVTHSMGQSEAWAPYLSGSDWLYFVSNRDGKMEIYRMSMNDGKVERVTHTPGKGSSIDVSVSSRKMVFFTSNRSGQNRIYWLDKNGELKEILQLKGEAWDPQTDNTGCLYYTSNSSGKREIYRLCNGNIEQVTHTTEEFESWQARPSKRGYVYFISNRSGKREIFRMNKDGIVEQVTHTAGQYESWGVQLWNADQVLFTSNRNGKQEVFFIGSEGNVLQYTFDEKNGQSATYVIE